MSLSHTLALVDEASFIAEQIRKVSQKCVYKRMIHPDQREDLQQDLYVRLLEGGWANICAAYQPGVSSFGYYVEFCLYNLSKNILQSRQHRYGADLLDYPVELVADVGLGVVPEDLVLVTRRLLGFVGLDTPKYRLLLKVKVNKPLTMNDLIGYAPEVPLADLLPYYEALSMPGDKRHYSRRLAKLLPLLQRVEPRACGLAGVQRDLKRKLNKLSNRLNVHLEYDFDKESLLNLLYIVL
ncbi:hypothetical protein [uncultured Microscilla sp.]|uniref:hypothetical protein n=1 Tax=uncultured Microscilla sp. TaxID=432653 RepID=UPI0026169765|nr:hypothetical protein [uncultured Microscilla sp.]